MNNRDMQAQAVVEISTQSDWVFSQWLDLSTRRLYKHPIKSTAKDLNPAIEEMNTEICERIS
ncbi:MAG: hypothetical protein HOB84_00330 [Candidatus Marinimicrobia bacterium]|nr:hypothetical protein [Candidatus Neomarinimicrobiota bacterium]